MEQDYYLVRAAAHQTPSFAVFSNQEILDQREDQKAKEYHRTRNPCSFDISPGEFLNWQSWIYHP